MERVEEFVDKFTDLLVERNVFQADKAQAIKKLFHDRSQPSYINFLLQEGLVERGDILNTLSAYYQVPAFDVVGHFFDHNLVRKFPKDFMLRNVFIPLELDENMLIVIAADPADPELLEKIGGYVSFTVRFMVGITQDITDAIKEFYELAVTEMSEDIDIRQEQREQSELEDILLYDEEED